MANPNFEFPHVARCPECGKQHLHCMHCGQALTVYLAPEDQPKRITFYCVRCAARFDLLAMPRMATAQPVAPPAPAQPVAPPAPRPEARRLTELLNKPPRLIPPPQTAERFPLRHWLGPDSTISPAAVSAAYRNIFGRHARTVKKQHRYTAEEVQAVLQFLEATR